MHSLPIGSGRGLALSEKNLWFNSSLGVPLTVSTLLQGLVETGLGVGVPPWMKSKKIARGRAPH